MSNRPWADENNLSADGVPVRRGSREDRIDVGFHHDANWARDLSPEVTAVTTLGYPVESVGDRDSSIDSFSRPIQYIRPVRSPLANLVLDESYEKTILFLFFVAFWLVALDATVLSFTLGVRIEPYDEEANGRGYSLPDQARHAINWTKPTFPIVWFVVFFDSVARLQVRESRWSSYSWHCIDLFGCIVWGILVVLLVNFGLLFDEDDDLGRSNAFVMRVFIDMAFVANLWRRIQAMGKKRREHIPIRIRGRPQPARPSMSAGPIPVIGTVMAHQDSFSGESPAPGVTDGVISSREATQRELDRP